MNAFLSSSPRALQMHLNYSYPVWISETWELHVVRSWDTSARYNGEHVWVKCVRNLRKKTTYFQFRWSFNEMQNFQVRGFFSAESFISICPLTGLCRTPSNYANSWLCLPKRCRWSDVFISLNNTFFGVSQEFYRKFTLPRTRRYKYSDMILITPPIWRGNNDVNFTLSHDTGKIMLTCSSWK